jgi:hypothetical protein
MITRLRSPGIRRRLCAAAAFAVVVSLLVFGAGLLANPHTGQSVNVVLIGGPSVINGGTFPTNFTAAEGPFTFTTMSPLAVSPASLAPFDTALLNVAGSNVMRCNINNLTVSQKQDIVNFVAAGKKLIIYDSECVPQNYSWLPFAFTTSNPGAMGATGTLTIVEENYLSSANLASTHYIDANFLGHSTDAIGDMNVMTTFDSHWCLDMTGTNALHVSGPVHTYTKYPAATDAGLIIYNGMDVDYLSATGTTGGSGWLRKVWLQELQQPFNPSGLACGFVVTGITLTPASATNVVGTPHTVTATLSDLLGQPQPNIPVTIEVTAGPHAGISALGLTNGAGQLSFAYTGVTPGTDTIVASFTPAGGGLIQSQPATKTWVSGNRITGGTYYYHDGYPEKLSLDVAGTTGWLKYFWPKTRMNFVASQITSATVTGAVVTINGVGTVNGVPGYTFTCMITDGPVDWVSMTINLPAAAGGGLYYAYSDFVDGGNVVIQ